MSCFFGSAMLGKRRLSAAMISRAVVDRQRRLADEGEAGRVAHLQPIDVGGLLHQVDARVRLAHRALDLGVPGVPDHHHLAPFLAHLGDFDVHLGDQRAGRIEDPQLARIGGVAHRARHAVRGEDHRRAVGHLVELVDEHRTACAQFTHHVLVVHDLVSHVDRCAVEIERALDDLDRSVHSGAKAARLCKKGFHALCVLVGSSVDRRRLVRARPEFRPRGRHPAPPADG